MLLCLWSSYGPEGPGTICSVQWQQRSGSARSYVICLFIFCLLLPLLLMFFCYGRILLAVRGVETRVRLQLDLRHQRSSSVGPSMIRLLVSIRGPEQTSLLQSGEKDVFF